MNFDAWHTPLTPEQYRSMSTRVVNRGDSTATTTTFTLSGDLFELPAGPLGIAGVLEWASQEYDLNDDPRILPTSPTDPPEQPLNLPAPPDGSTHSRYAAAAAARGPRFQPPGAPR